MKSEVLVETHRLVTILEFLVSIFLHSVVGKEWDESSWIDDGNKLPMVLVVEVDDEKDNIVAK